MFRIGNKTGLILILFAFVSCYASSLDYSGTIIASRLRNLLVPADITTTNANALKWMKSLLPNGSWSDIAYTDKNLEVWLAAEHLNPRLRDMSLSYYAPSSSLHGNTTLLKSILLALDFWLDSDLQNPNWWWNDIQMPVDLAIVVNLLPEELTPEQISKSSAVLSRRRAKGETGANYEWLSMLSLSNGILQKNNDIIASAVDNITKGISQAPLSGSATGGIMVDNSFFQHGFQLYTGAYGAYYTQQVLFFLYYTFNTTYAVSKEHLDVFSSYILDGQQWAINYPSLTWDIAVRGRMNTRRQGAACKFASKYNFPRSDMKCFDPQLVSSVADYGVRTDEWMEYSERLNEGGSPLKGNKMYWFADFMVHSRPTYRTSVKMNAKGLKGAECVNTEGKKSAHFSDGANYLYISGNDYVDIFPTWDWDKIPGVTAKTNGIPLDCTTSNHAFGESTNVGGVSDGMYGIAAMDFTSSRQKLSVKKVWFFFDVEYVALGSDIKCEDCSQVTTSVAQRLLTGDVYSSTSQSALKQGVHVYNDMSWTFHGGVGYIFPRVKSGKQVNTTLYNEIKEGKWFDIGIQTGTIEKEVFGLYITHDEMYNGYEYIIVPSTTYTNFKQYQVDDITSKVIIVANNADIQAVYHHNLNKLMAVFWVPGKIEYNGISIMVDKPCGLILSNETNNVSITLSNLSKELVNNEVHVTINQVLDGTGCSGTEETGSVFDFKLPGSASNTGLLGKSLSITCSKQ